MWNNNFLYRALLYVFIGVTIYLVGRHVPEEALGVPQSVSAALLVVITIVAVDFVVSKVIECRSDKLLDEISAVDETCKSCQTESESGESQ